MRGVRSIRVAATAALLILLKQLLYLCMVIIDLLDFLLLQLLQLAFNILLSQIAFDFIEEVTLRRYMALNMTPKAFQEQRRIVLGPLLHQKSDFFVFVQDVSVLLDYKLQELLLVQVH